MIVTSSVYSAFSVVNKLLKNYSQREDNGCK
ncbi:hypothetical protein P3J6_121569 [Pseudoalteromonas sp. 3J6]|nr:hypothetical protein P3J6_121569 [Pseudoalteromonas sp. 3J6]